MRDQHKKISGYRDLTQGEIDLINVIKEAEANAAEAWKVVAAQDEIDGRWLAIARTHIQEGFTALVRAISQPVDPFDLPLNELDRPKLANLNAEAVARMFHETYERLAPRFGYATREASAVPWAKVPDQNKALMIAVADELIGRGLTTDETR